MIKPEQKRLMELVEYVSSHRKLPPVKDALRGIYNTYCYHSSKQFNKEAYSLICQFVPKLRYRRIKTSKAVSENKSNIIRFINSYGHRPSKCAADAYERTLAHFMSSYSQVSQPLYDAGFSEQIEELCPKISAAKSRKLQKSRILEELRATKLPRSEFKDRFSYYLYKRSKAFDQKLLVKVDNFFDQRNLEYRLNKIYQVFDFILGNARLPSRSGGSIEPSLYCYWRDEINLEIKAKFRKLLFELKGQSIEEKSKRLKQLYSECSKMSPLRESINSPYSLETANLIK